MLHNDKKYISFGPCADGRNEDKRQCFSFSKKSSVFTKNITFPMAINEDVFLHFISKGFTNSQRSFCQISFFSHERVIFSTGINFSPVFEYYFSQNDQVMSSGPIIEDGPLTHSVSVFLKKNGVFEFYFDGIPYGFGNISVFGGFSSMRIDISNGNKHTKLGHLYVSDGKSDMHNILIASLLKYRNLEREIRIQEEMNDIERSVYGFAIDLSKDDLSHLILSNNDADPRRFEFPFVIPPVKQNSKSDEL